jgi:hypothetical protein
MSWKRERMRERLTYPDVKDRLFNYIDTPKRQGHHLAWCGESGFEPITIGAVA